MWQFAVQNILSRPVRTILSVLSLTVAIAGMVGLYSIAGGIDTVVTATFRLIPGLLVQQRGAPVPIFSSLPADWEEEMEAMPGVAVVNPPWTLKEQAVKIMPWLASILTGGKGNFTAEIIAEERT